MVYLLTMVDLSMAILNNQMIINVATPTMPSMQPHICDEDAVGKLDRLDSKVANHGQPNTVAGLFVPCLVKLGIACFALSSWLSSLLSLGSPWFSRRNPSGFPSADSGHHRCGCQQPVNRIQLGECEPHQCDLLALDWAWILPNCY